MSNSIDSEIEEDPVSLRKVSQSLFRFTLSTILLTTITFIVISSVVIKSTLGELYERFTDREAKNLQVSVNRIVDAKLSTLSDHASLPFVVNSVMNPDVNDPSVSDYLENLRILNREADIILLDIDGEVIYSTSRSADFNWRKEAWIANIVDNGLPNHVTVFKGGDVTYMRMAVPVLYNGLAEGVLVGVTPSMLDDAFDDLIEQEGMYATILSRGQILHASGDSAEGSGFVKELDLPSIQGSLRLVVQETAVVQGLTKLFLVGALAGLLASALFVFVFRRLGIKLVIEPQRLLERSRVQTMRLNKKLGEANEELAQFSYRASHDLKAPLVSARGLAQLIVEDITDGDYTEAVKNAHSISKQLQRLERLVITILDLAKADLQETSEQDLDLSELLGEISDRLKQLSLDNEVSIDCHVAPQTRVYASPSRLTQVLENLMSNGIKYSNRDRNDRFVKVTATISGDLIEIAVKDNGIGIPEEYQSQVFDMFKRFHPSVSFGSGLGMYMIKKNLDNMNTKIEFSSSTCGSEFRISLPTSVSALQRASAFQ